MFRSSWRTALAVIVCWRVEWFDRLVRSKSDNKEMRMLEKWEAESELRVKAGALIGAVWLVVLSSVGAYAQAAPTPANSAAAVYTARAFPST
jgi:hypothetical protein